MRTTDKKALVLFVAYTVGQDRNISLHDIMHASRGRAPIALARQISMYLMSTALGISMTEIGKVFRRDRTTIGHACALVEDMRDDPEFDARLSRMEEVIGRLITFVDVAEAA